MDKLQDEFQCEIILQSEREDSKWVKIAALTDSNKSKKYVLLPHVMLSILTIPHSNAACERVFSFIRKNKTDFRSTLSDNTVESLMILRSAPGLCYERKHSDVELRR